MGGGGLVCPPNPFHRLLTPWPSAVGSRPSEPGEASHPHPALPRSCICKNALKMAKPWVKTPDLALCSASVRVLSLCRCAHFLRLRLGFICNVLKAKGSTLASGCAGLINARAEPPPPPRSRSGALSPGHIDITWGSFQTPDAQVVSRPGHRGAALAPARAGNSPVVSRCSRGPSGPRGLLCSLPLCVAVSWIFCCFNSLWEEALYALTTDGPGSWEVKRTRSFWSFVFCFFLDVPGIKKPPT